MGSKPCFGQVRGEEEFLPPLPGHDGSPEGGTWPGGVTQALLLPRAFGGLSHSAATAGTGTSIRTGIDFAAGTLLPSAWCQSGISGLHSG